MGSVIEIRLSPVDLARLRFARSPIQELTSSLNLLGDPRRQATFHPWLASARPRVAALGLELLPALVGGPHFVADFLTPPPVRTGVEFPEELERVRASAPALVRASVDEMRGEKPVPEALCALYDDPERTLGRVADELSAYWEAVIQPIWPRLRAFADADIGYRAQMLTTAGLARLLADLHPKIEHTSDGMVIHTPRWSGRHIMQGSGLVLVPCVFAWPQLIALFDEPRQSMLTYAPRGIATVWDDTPDAESAPLGELIGRSRAAMLAHLDLPLSTTQLATYVGLTPAAVSQHLSVLRRNSLVTSRRSGRAVLYERTALASRLLGS